MDDSVRRIWTTRPRTVGIRWTPNSTSRKTQLPGLLTYLCDVDEIIPTRPKRGDARGNLCLVLYYVSSADYVVRGKRHIGYYAHYLWLANVAFWTYCLVTVSQFNPWYPLRFYLHLWKLWKTKIILILCNKIVWNIEKIYLFTIVVLLVFVSL